jgi:putative inorganic carbon (HCO3(-)) transporter
MRDYVLMALIFGMLPVCVFRPWVGFIIWFWFGLMNPHRLTWDIARNFPFAMYIGGATLLGMLLAKDRKPIPWNAELILIVLLFAYFTFTTLFAWAPETAWSQLEKVFKILLMTLLSTMFIYGKKRVSTLIFTIALSIGFYGFKGAVFVVNTGGAGQVQGPAGSFLDGNTFIGLGMNMVLPVILFLARDDERLWVKRLLYVLFGLTIISIIFTTSRGAYVGLAVMLPLMFLRSNKKWLALLVMIPALVAAPYILPERIFQRANTIENYEEESSANQRLEAWLVAWRLAKDHPLTGAGFDFETVMSQQLWTDYSDERFAKHSRGVASAHSIYFQILGQHGFIALALFLGLLASSMLRMQRIIRMAQRRAGFAWLANYATGIQIGLVGYIVSGAFLSSGYFDLAYLYFALGAIFERELDTVTSVGAPVVTGSQLHVALQGRSEAG